MKISARQIFFTAAFFCASAVAFGAFGAHALKNLLETTGRIPVFETASKYHFLHGLGLFVIGFLLEKYPSRMMRGAFWTMTFGVLIFSGSLYLLCLLDMPKLGMITPFGGVMLIAAWILTAFAARKNRETSD